MFWFDLVVPLPHSPCTIYMCYHNKKKQLNIWKWCIVYSTQCFCCLLQNVYVNISRIMSVGNRLLEAGHYATQQIQQISGQLEQEWKAFAAALDERSTLLEMSANFLQKTDQVRPKCADAYLDTLSGQANWWIDDDAACVLIANHWLQTKWLATYHSDADIISQIELQSMHCMLDGLSDFRQWCVVHKNSYPVFHPLTVFQKNKWSSCLKLTSLAKVRFRIQLLTFLTTHKSFKSTAMALIRQSAYIQRQNK